MQGEPVARPPASRMAAATRTSPTTPPTSAASPSPSTSPDGSRTDISSQSAAALSVQGRRPLRGVPAALEAECLLGAEDAAVLGPPPGCDRRPRVNLAVLEAAPQLRRDRLLRAARLQLARLRGRRALRPLRLAPHVDPPPLGRGEAKRLGRDYLREEIAKRLETGPSASSSRSRSPARATTPTTPRASGPRTGAPGRRHPRGHRALARRATTTSSTRPGSPTASSSQTIPVLRLPPPGVLDLA